MSLDLGDVAIGGDGTGVATVGTGLSPRAGTLVAPTVWGGFAITGPSFIATDGTGGTFNLPWVDGVIVADGVTTIDSLGNSFAFADTAGSSWDVIRGGKAVYDKDAVPAGMIPIRLADQPGVDRPGLGLHANAGLTFDLAAMRAATGGSTLRFEGVAGLNYDQQGATGADIEIWVLVDGVQQFRHAFHGGTSDLYAPVVIPLDDTARFLTVVASDYNTILTADHAVLADARLVLKLCGNGVLGPDEECDDGNDEAGDGCNAACVVEPCWSCDGAPSSCAVTKRTTCLVPDKAALLVKESHPGKEGLKVALTRLAAAVAQTQFGDPVAGMTRYDVCVFDDTDVLVAALRVARASSTCGSALKPCWKAISTLGYKYKDPDASADGVGKILGRSDIAGKGKIIVKAKNNAAKGQAALPTGIAAALAGATSPTVQVVTSDADCFAVTLTNVSIADGVLFKAKEP